jgi:UDP-N-acetyl-D-glucosamine/UDP-N-acetyl-D-galactosamine dehydrogenase
MNIYEDLLQKKQKLAVIGLGYVGLPVALAFARKLQVIGFDINEQRIALLRQGTDPGKEWASTAFENCDIEFTASVEVLQEARFFIVAVPTPVDEHNVPNLKPLLSASETVGRVLKKGDYVVYESTVYPGCMEEDCLPVMEQWSGLKMGEDFKLGYSPERINPGDKKHTLQNVVKVVSGCDEESLNIISQVYQLVVEAGVYKAPSIKVAEAAKIIENTQRDFNIAFMNELAMMFDKMGISTHDVLQTAATKWNFLPFFPGLVGGHCISVDPYYLIYKAAQLGYTSKLILSGRSVNDGMAAYVVKKILQHILQYTENAKNSKVLIMGATFKENVSDVRNSKICEVVQELKDYSVQVEVTDPIANPVEIEQEYGFALVNELATDYDAILFAVPHTAFTHYTEKDFIHLTKPQALIADLRGIYRGKIQQRKYWSL